MPRQEPEELDRIFGALADPTRRSILSMLANRPHSVGELAQPHNMSAPAITKHLKVLEVAGLLDREKRGREHICRFNPGPLTVVSGWIDHYRANWARQFEALDAYLRHLSDTHRH